MLVAVHLLALISSCLMLFSLVCLVVALIRRGNRSRLIQGQVITPADSPATSRMIRVAAALGGAGAVLYALFLFLSK